MLSQIWALIAFTLAFSASKEVSSIFNELIKLESPDASNPQRAVTFQWAINGSVVNPGDTFTLSVPCIREVKGANITDGDKVLAQCVYLGGNIATDPKVICTVSSLVNAATRAKGCVEFIIVLGEVHGPSEWDLSFASCFSPGVNELVFVHGDEELTVKTTIYSSSVYADYCGRLNRWPINSYYFKAPSCYYGYQYIELGVSVTNGIDCDSVGYYLAKNLNDFGQPSGLSFLNRTLYSCNLTSGFSLKVESLPQGSQPVVFWNETLNGLPTNVTVNDAIHCVLGTEADFSFKKQLPEINNNLWLENSPVNSTTTSSMTQAIPFQPITRTRTITSYVT